MTKEKLLEQGKDLAEEFCALNGIKLPDVSERSTENWPFGACAYYRPTYIAICVNKCAAVGVAGRSWSWLGYVVDRTPYGVIQHELGHHVDFINSETKGSYFGDFSVTLRKVSAEAPLTGYCPNDAEWFAEIFRLFLTNPSLLSELRPRVWRELDGLFTSAVTASWEQVLAGAPERTIEAAKNKIKKEKKNAG